jgi:deazaflavin-dependent oxidoreductase (nitroreductase family)
LQTGPLALENIALSGSAMRDDERITDECERESYLYLITRGRKSGRPREIEIWFTHRDGCFYVIAEYSTSQWVQNLRADSQVQVRVAGKSFFARARILSAETDSELYRSVQEQSRKKYGWGEGLVVELVPE